MLMIMPKIIVAIPFFFLPFIILKSPIVLKNCEHNGCYPSSGAVDPGFVCVITQGCHRPPAVVVLQLTSQQVSLCGECVSYCCCCASLLTMFAAAAASGSAVVILSCASNW